MSPPPDDFYLAGGLDTVSTFEYQCMILLGALPLLYCVGSLLELHLRLQRSPAREHKAKFPKELKRLLAFLARAVVVEEKRCVRVTVVAITIGCSLGVIGVGPTTLHLARRLIGGGLWSGSVPARASSAAYPELRMAMGVVSSFSRAVCFLIPVLGLRPTDRIAVRGGFVVMMVLTVGIFMEGLTENIFTLAPLAAAGRDMPSRHLRPAACGCNVSALTVTAISFVRQLKVMLRLTTRRTVAGMRPILRDLAGGVGAALAAIIVVDGLIIAADGGSESPYRSLRAQHCVILVSPVAVFVTCLVCTPANRLLLHRLIGEWGVEQDSLSETRRLAAVAALMSCGGYGWEKRAHQAATRFRAIPFSALSPSHLASSALTPAERDLFVRALREPALGTVDAFVSHSWSDEPTAKYEALRIWADKFAQAHGRQPLLWLDKACIDRGDANTSLAYVPIYASACRQFIVLAGKTYRHRLWCVMEIFCFLTMGGSVGDIILLDVRDCTPDDQTGTDRAPSVRVRGGSFRSLWRADTAGSSSNSGTIVFRVEDTQCAIEADRDRMLSIIDASYGDITLFEADMQQLLCGKHAYCRWSQDAVSGNGRPRDSDRHGRLHFRKNIYNV